MERFDVRRGGVSHIITHTFKTAEMIIVHQETELAKQPGHS